MNIECPICGKTYPNESEYNACGECRNKASDELLKLDGQIEEINRKRRMLRLILEDRII